MKVIKRNKDGIIMPFNEIMAQRTDVTVIENYEAGKEITPKALPKRRRRKKAAPLPAAESTAEDILDGLDD